MPTLKRVTTATSAIFTSHQQARLEQIQRFLVHACDPDIAAVLAQVGFDAEELELGWTDWDISVGRKIPFELHLASQKRGQRVGLSQVQQDRLDSLDEFENDWYVRVRNAIRRFVVKEQRAAFEAAFFQDLRRSRFPKSRRSNPRSRRNQERRLRRPGRRRPRRSDLGRAERHRPRSLGTDVSLPGLDDPTDPLIDIRRPRDRRRRPPDRYRSRWRPTSRDGEIHVERRCPRG
ncbi:MAG: hypothetical protein ACOC1F_08350 [Myxococcota bacterium]